MKPTVMLPAFALASLATVTFVSDDELGAPEIQQSCARATPEGARTAPDYVTFNDSGDVLTNRGLVCRGAEGPGSMRRRWMAA
jgi:hypothetical protein